MFRAIWSLWILILVLAFGTAAQEEPSAPVINSENVVNLALVRRIDFADIDETIISEPVFESGWFALDSAGQQMAIVTAAQDLLIINDAGERLFDIPAPRNEDELALRMIDAGFAHTSTGLPFVATYSDGQQLVLNVVGEGMTGGLAIATREMPAAQWMDCPDLDGDECAVWLEMIDLQRDRTSILELPLSLVLAENDAAQVDADELARVDYAPGTAEQAFVRIGRIEPPHVVTSTPDGQVNLWHLQSQESVAQAHVENGPVVFGQLNASASHLAWRGPASDALYLLDFTTGDNQRIADLNGAYAQFFLVSQNADVIFAVHVNDEPVIVAWDVASGQRYEVGEYGPCSREPDMARLSADGTTLVVGCDTGLEIWRVADMAGN